MTEEIKPKTEDTGEKQARAGKGGNIPPKETQWKPGESGNPEGKDKGTPNRSTIAREILQMMALPSDIILENLRAMYPVFFRKKTKKWTIEFLMSLRLAQRAILKGDVPAYNAIMDSAYGKARQTIEHEGEVDTGIGELAKNLQKIYELANEPEKGGPGEDGGAEKEGDKGDSQQDIQA